MYLEDERHYDYIRPVELFPLNTTQTQLSTVFCRGEPSFSTFVLKWFLRIEECMNKYLRYLVLKYV